MTLQTFLVSLAVTALILFIARKMWFELIVLYYLIQIAGLAFVSMLIWCALVVVSSENWGLVWLYFLLTYLGIVSVFIGIVKDTYGVMSTLVRKILK